MKSNAPLKLIKNTHRVIDITALNHADIKPAEYWAGVHVDGDKPSRIVDLPDRPRRSWWK